ncbi:uncharacterized protein N7459_000823 [Penicillium hispanicum]|uniref:uncharacterized protein n=1 Tax=Penicillium hispanicum TaxID=1080232 RepID=UPI002541E928|nr:uncharacterized protein N7459_000823 [Penicillium hispanicum]KAJ5594615.1 hypothetical protein N7459_000823 [Penicillium hispanicum]
MSSKLETDEARELPVPSQVASSVIETTPTSPDPIVSDKVPEGFNRHLQEVHQKRAEPAQRIEQPGEPSRGQFYDPLKALIDNKISLVEYGSQVQYRYGYGELPTVVEWVVPDEELLFASQILLEHDFPRLCGQEPDWLSYWDKKCRRHDLDGHGWMCIHLLPLSLVGLNLKETIEVPSLFAQDLRILTPKPPQYMLSLIRCLLRLPPGDKSRLRVEKDLRGFISAYIMDDSLVNEAQSVNEENEEHQERVQNGVQFMKTWDWGNIEGRYKGIAERAVQDYQYIGMMTDQPSTTE